MAKRFFVCRTVRFAAAVFAGAVSLCLAAAASGSIFVGSARLAGTSGASAVSRSGICVTAYDSAGNAAYSSVADENGEFELYAEKDGVYTVEISAPGYLSCSFDNVDVSAGAKCVELPEAVLECGDADGNGIVDMADKLWLYRINAQISFAGAWHKTAFDFNRDGTVDTADTALLSANMGKSKSNANVSSECITPMRRNNYAAYELVYDPGFLTGNTKRASYPFMQSGWTFDGRGGIPRNSDTSPYLLSDISKEYGTAYVRELNVQTEGRLELRTKMNIAGNRGNGAGIMLYSTDEETVYELITADGYYCVRKPDGTLLSLEHKVNSGGVNIYVIIDLDKGNAHTYVNGEDLGESELCGGNNIANFKIFTADEESGITISPSYAYIDANYAVKEDFNITDNAGVPFGWSLTSGSGASSKVASTELVLTADAAEDSFAKAYVQTDRLAGNVIYESLEYMDVQSDGFCVSLKYKDKDIVKLYTVGGAFYANGTLVKDSYYENFWNMLRIEADTDKNTAVIKINGKVKATVPFLENAPYIDGLEFSLNPTSVNCTAKIDGVEFYQQKVTDDYVPEPVKPSDSNGYYVGINMCNLWKNGEHWGWDNITPYNEATPVIGYYDDDLPEAADWQIKFMVEHGVDWQAICWYGSQSNDPIKETRMSGGLNEAFFNAKYSDMMDFAILWEASNASCPASLEAWKNYFVPYWTEYFLSDSRYARIDNKAIICVFGAEKLYSSEGFGSVEACREAFDYLEQVCIGLGYDGCIFMACSTTSTASDQQTLSDAGFDCTFAYNYGIQGYNINDTMSAHTAQHNAGKIHVVPTISTGFNNVAWGDTRKPNMSVDDMKTIFAWVKNTVFGSWYSGASENWKKKLMMLSTWNEYGEGTYIMPANLNGFGYLDAVKSAFTDNNTSCSDVKPTASQLSRLGYLFPQYRQILRPALNGERSLGSSGQGNQVFKHWFLERNNMNSVFSNVNCTVSRDNSIDALKVTPTNNDPIINCSFRSFNAEDVPGFVIRAKIPVGKTMVIYFATDSSPSLDESKTVKITSDSSEMKDYYFQMSSNPLWKGTIKQIRLDPVNANLECWLYTFTALGPTTFRMYIDGTEYYMDKISSINDVTTYLSESATNPDTVLAKSISTVTYPFISGSNTLVPFFPEMGICDMLSVYYTWRKDTGELRIRGNGADVTYTMGSSTAVVNGASVSLGCTPVVVDGLPMIPIEHLISCFGSGFTLEVTKEGSVYTYNITTPNNDYWNNANYVSTADKYHWEFNKLGDSEGWQFVAAGHFVGEIGCLSGESYAVDYGVGYDPVIITSNLEIDPKKYDKIEVRMKFNGITSNHDTQLFYMGTKDGVDYGASESRSIKLPIKTADNGVFKEYLFDFSADETYKSLDVITALRFDPINSQGWFDIDYIRIYEADEVYTYTFDTDAGGWTNASITDCTVSGGVLKGTATLREGNSTPYDPMLSSPALSLDSYYFNKIDVTMKLNLDTDAQTYIVVFYMTSDMTQFSAACQKGVKVTKEQGQTFATYTFDMSEDESWSATGWISKIRLDPLACAGSFEIDSIRFYH